MNDVGLCSASQDILIDDILFDNPEFNDFKGGLTENYVQSYINIIVSIGLVEILQK